MVPKRLVCILAIFQIILLINLVVAEPYRIHQAEHSVSNKSISGKEQEIVKKVIVLLTAILSIKQIGTVSAATLSVGCCKELKSGAICEDLVSASANLLCKTSLLSTSCSQVDSCKLGCCVDNKRGTCDSKSTKEKCQINNGTWNPEPNCKIDECNKACCILGEEMQFTTEKECEQLSLFYGTKKDFRAAIKNELDCLSTSKTQEAGSCIYTSRSSCDSTTKEQCTSMGGTFYKNIPCSSASLLTNCTKQASIGCVEGKDEIYWFDSCGNRENIYSSDKTASWNNGKTLTKAKSCNPTSSNIDSTTCGNCNRALSSTCAPSTIKHVVDGNFICKNLKCVDAEGNIRENGESWCIYDSYIGDGKDTVGSEHWRAYCNRGEVEVDVCGDYRGKICVQSIMESGGKKFSIASCAVNNAFECIMFNKETDIAKRIKKCEASEFCMIKKVNVDAIQINYCVGKYPKGFDSNISSANAEICNIADITCQVVYKKDITGKWKCHDNCQCEQKVFSEQINDLCISLGDCGTYVNFKGKGTENTVVTGAPGNDWSEYVQYAKPVKGQYAKSGSLKATLALLLGGTSPGGMSDKDGAEKAIQIVGGVMGGIGALAYGLGATGIWTSATVYGVGGTIAWSPGIAAGSAGASQAVAGAASSAAPGSVIVSASSLTVAAAGFAMGMALGSWLASSQGITGTPALIMGLAGGVAGAIALYAWVYGVGTVYPVGTIVAVIAVIIIVVISAIGWGKTEDRKVTFECNPWEAPLGGDDCEKCQDDPQRACTQYRCNSLGQACFLLNPENEFPVCKSMVRENIAPKIFIVNASKGYRFRDITQDGATFVGEIKRCIQEFTPVSFTLGTDEHAQCIASFTLPASKKFEEMGEIIYPAEQNAFTLNHIFGVSMPSLSSLDASNLSGDLREMYADMSMYVRCRDYWGNYNIDEYIINFCINPGPDITPVSNITAVPPTGTILPYGKKEMNVNFYLNEPAECKYSDSSGKKYNEMNSSMDCNTDVFKSTPLGWECKMTMPLLEEENKIYIRCKDQPWFAGTINETNRNTNQEDYEYLLYVSGELNITETSPTGMVEKGSSDTSLELEVKTLGGVDEGVSACYLGESFSTLFSESFSTIHKHNITVMNGAYNIPIECEDSIGNIATGTINFSVDLQTSAPIVTRAYREGGNLIILTNKKAECYYDLQTCNFDIVNGTLMTTGLSTTHIAPWDTGKTYYVKCKDKWGNMNPQCAIKVKPS